MKEVASYSPSTPSTVSKYVTQNLHVRQYEV